MIFPLLEEQGWGSDPTSVARVQIPASTPYVGLLLVFSFAPSSHLASSAIMDMRGERSESRENARSHGRGKGELSLSFPAPRTRVSFRVMLSWTSRDSSKCGACSERFFSGYSRFSSLLKNQRFQIPIRPGMIDFVDVLPLTRLL